MRYIQFFNNIRNEDYAQVGAKTFSLALLMQEARSFKIEVPNGFAITVASYWRLLEYNDLKLRLEHMIVDIADYDDLVNVEISARAIQDIILKAAWPEDLAQEIKIAYLSLSNESEIEELNVAVRSSATAEDLPEASFAGQQDTFLNIRSYEAVLEACKKCFASLFTTRALVYRAQRAFENNTIALSIAVQKMVNASTAGVAFSLDTETGFKDVVVINASYGLGQSVVSGMVIPDEYMVYKPLLTTYNSIVKKQRGSKQQQVVFDHHGTAVSEVPISLQKQFCLTEVQIIEIARTVTALENYYSQKKRQWYPIDVEWAYDENNTLFILQVRPETVHSRQTKKYCTYKLKATSSLAILLRGQSIGQQIVSGKVRIIENVQDRELVSPGDIIVTTMTDPDWIPALKKAAGIITTQGGRTCHAAIISRELAIPALVGAENALAALKTGMAITLDCTTGAQGLVYEGLVPYERIEHTFDTLPTSSVECMVNCADPDNAFGLSFLPVAGVGLARMEFIITSAIKVHPLALLNAPLLDEQTRHTIEQIASAYKSPSDFFVETLACAIGRIAAAFYPRPVIVRLSDFKTNEYRNLIGGTYFEPLEENPMLGFRGALRYYSDSYKMGFALECAALKKVRDSLGLTNVKVMVPFVRTLNEAHHVLQEMKENGLARGQNGLEIIMMCEIPSNVLLIDDFLTFFDGISIGSNDLTQLTLGVDRDSALLAPHFNEQDPAMKKMFAMAIAGTKRAGKYSGICGQAPSDYPELAEYLIDCGITSISLNPDSVIPFLQRVKRERACAKMSCLPPYAA